MVKILDHIFLMRPTLLITSWGFLLAGYYRATQKFFHLSKDFWIIFIAYTLLCGAGYILNQIEDIESDKINRKLFLLSEGIIPVSHAYLQTLLLIIGAFILIMKKSTEIKILFTLSLIMAMLYSLPPFRWKDKPFLDLFLNSTGYGIVNFLAGWSIAKDITFSAFLNSLPYFFGVGAIFLLTTLLDIEGDKRVFKITTGIKLGIGNTLKLSYIFIVIAGVCAVLRGDWVAGTVAGTGIVLFLFPLINFNRKNCIMAQRITGFILILILSCIYPVFLIINSFLVVSMYLYYKKRFGISYPSFFK